MALDTTKQVINNGSFLDDPSAEAVYTSFEKAKINFNTIWLLLENQGFEKFFLDLNGIETDGVMELEYVAAAIERGKKVSGAYGGVWTVAPIGRKPLFYTITPSGTPTIGGSGTGISYEYRFYRVHKKGQVFGGSGGVLIEANDVSPAGSFIIGSVNQNPSLYINLGDIGTADVWDAFNLGDGGDPWLISGIKNIYATQSGVNRTWSFTGNQRLNIDSGEWGGSDISNPDYLAAIEADFDLLSNQPVVYPDIFITKSSKKYRDYTLTGATSVAVLLTPEYTTYNVNVTGGVGQIKGILFIFRFHYL